MKLIGVCNQASIDSSKPACKSRVHIIDGFSHADNMEHFAKAVLKKQKMLVL